MRDLKWNKKSGRHYYFLSCIFKSFYYSIFQKSSFPRFPGPRSPRPPFGPPRFMRGPRPPWGPQAGPPRPPPPSSVNFPSRPPFRNRPPFLHSYSVSGSGPPPHSGPFDAPLGPRKSSFDLTSRDDYPQAMSPTPPDSPSLSDLFPRIKQPSPNKSQESLERRDSDFLQYKTDSNIRLTRQALVIIIRLFVSSEQAAVFAAHV